MAAFRLPVSGLDVLFSQTTGAEDILLAEATALDTRMALTLADALCRLPDGAAVPWVSLPVTDLDAGLLAIRRFIIGDHVKSSVVCAAVRQPARSRIETAAACNARIDIAFRIGDYLSHHAPSLPRGVSPAEVPGWFRLDGTEVTYRLVSCADQIAVSGLSNAEQELARRCIRPETVARPVRREVEAAMEKLAPSLFGVLDGNCPECAARIRVSFDPQRYVLGELRERAMFVYEEVHLLASRYQWSEREILALPGSRRARYAEFADQPRIG
jgi:hypothetical protein